MKYKIHPAADEFPDMPEKDYQALKEDIEKHGQKEPIILFADDRVIDGRHRLRVCEELGIEPLVTHVLGDVNPYELVFSYNLHRRHLTPAQAAAKVAEKANAGRGGQKGNKNAAKQAGLVAQKSDKNATKQGVKTNAPAGAFVLDDLNVGRRSVQRAKKVRERGSQALNDALKAGDIKTNTAVRLIDACEDEEKQTELVQQGEKAVLEFLRNKKAKPRNGKSMDDICFERLKKGPVLPAELQKLTGAKRDNRKNIRNLRDRGHRIRIVGGYYVLDPPPEKHPGLTLTTTSADDEWIADFHDICSEMHHYFVDNKELSINNVNIPHLAELGRRLIKLFESLTGGKVSPKLSRETRTLLFKKA